MGVRGLILVGLFRTDSVKKKVLFVFENGNQLFLIGYHFEEFRSQLAIRKKIKSLHHCTFIHINAPS